MGTGRLVAMVGTTDASAGDVRNLHILFGLVFFPPVWPIRTRHGPYNCVSSEKQ